MYRPKGQHARARISPLSISGGLGRWGLKIGLLGLFDALIITFAVHLYAQQSYVFFGSVVVGALLINLAALVEKAYPLRYLLPGLIFMAAMILYPLVYNVYVSFTNYGTGNILSRQQVIEQLTAQRYAPPDAPKYPYTLFADPADNLVVLLEAPDGAWYASVGDQVLPIAALPDVSDEDGDGVIDAIGQAVRLERRDVLRRIPALEALRLEWGETTLQLADANHFQALLPRYVYEAHDGALVDQQTGVRYLPRNGFFTSPEGETLLPGFRVPVGLANYTRLITNPAISGPFIHVFVWTFVWAGASVALTFTLGFALALLLNNPYLRLKGIYRALLIVPYTIPGFVSALVWRGLLNTEFGQVNRVVQALFGTQIPWLQDPFWAKVGLLLVNLWLGYPYMMIVTLGALQSISPELYEAAYCDGAKPRQQLRFITLPLLMTSVAPLLISSFAYNFNNFTIIYLVTRGRPPIAGAVTPAGATDILISYTYRLAFEGGRGADYGLAAAVSLLIFMIIGTITWINFRFTKALEEVGQGV